MCYEILLFFWTGMTIFVGLESQWFKAWASLISIPNLNLPHHILVIFLRISSIFPFDKVISLFLYSMYKEDTKLGGHGVDNSKQDFSNLLHFILIHQFFGTLSDVGFFYMPEWEHLNNASVFVIVLVLLDWVVDGKKEFWFAFQCENAWRDLSSVIIMRDCVFRVLEFVVEWLSIILIRRWFSWKALHFDDSNDRKVMSLQMDPLNICQT